MAQTATLRALAEPLLGEVGLELWDLEVSPTAVRFLVDRAEGVDLDSLSDASRVISDLLDAHEELAPPAGYSLEISSPGLERSLRSTEQFQRFVGSEVTVKTARPVAGSRRHRGSLVAVDEAGIVLAVEERPGDPLPISFEEIERARTVFVWEPGAPKPGARRAARSPVGSEETTRSSPESIGTRRSRPAKDRRSALESDTDLAQGPPVTEDAPAAHRQKDSSR
jgi:ribosome maturation factor RimP